MTPVRVVCCFKPCLTHASRGNTYGCGKQSLYLLCWKANLIKTCWVYDVASQHLQARWASWYYCSPCMSSPSLMHQPASLCTTADPTHPSLQQQLSCLQSSCLTLLQAALHHSMTTVLVVFRSAAWRGCLLSPSSASTLPAGQSRWSALDPVLHQPSQSPSPHSRSVSRLTRGSPVLASPIQGVPGSHSATSADIHHHFQLSGCFRHTLIWHPTCHRLSHSSVGAIRGCKMCKGKHGLAAYCPEASVLSCCSKLPVVV